MTEDEDSGARDERDPMSEDEAARGVSRRGFLQGSSLAIAAGALLGTDARAEHLRAPAALGPGPVPVPLQINGKAYTVAIEPRETLASVLRDRLGLTGTKIGCDRGACSACTVHLDGMPVASCMTLAIDVGARKVTTIEGLARGETLHPVQEQFIAHDAMQCGYCTPGMVMSCAALLSKTPLPTLDDVKGAVSGNLCRCGTYPKVFAATLAAAGQPVPAGTLVMRAGEVLEQPCGGAIPAGEPPPWPHNDRLVVVSKPTPRLDGRAKVTGAAKYTADIQLPGMLYARRVVSTVAHARVKAVDTTAAAKLPGVKAVHVVEHLREGAVLRKPGKADRYPTVRYVGQTIAAVAAATQAIADEAAALVKVDYEALPFVVDLDAARKAGAPAVYPGPTDMMGSAGGGGARKGLPQKGNVRGPNETAKGDVAAAMRKAAYVVEGEFRTGIQTHSAMEPHGVVADFRAEGLTVYASTQGTASVRDELAEVMGLPASKVRVLTEHMGGGFGAKFGAGTYGVLAAQLSKQAGAPVRLVLDRREEHTSVGNRPSSIQRLKLGADKDGRLVAMDLEAYGTAGIGLGAGVGPWTQMLYPTPAFRSAQYDVFTNAGPGCAFRAPGAPQSMFAVEQLVDELAEKLGKDPIALRDLLDAGDDRADREARRRERKLAAERAGWARRRPPGSDRGPVRRGIGMAQAIWGRFVNTNAACEVRLERDGTIEILSSVQDLGTGTRTALAQVVAEEMGVRARDVVVRIGDTQHPIGPPSGGSMTLLAITAPARTAAFRVKARLFEAIAPSLGAPKEELALRDGQVFSRGKPALSLKQAAARLRVDRLSEQAERQPDYGGDKHDGYGGVQICEVAVDVGSGVVKVERVVAVYECGRVINPLAAQSQINGGILQGLSWALYEARHLDAATGRMVNANLEQYKIAGARETPQIEVVLLEQYQGRNATDANGIGEPANIPTAAAIANAVYNAIGVRVRELPMRPAVVLAALARGGRR